MSGMDPDNVMDMMRLEGIMRDNPDGTVEFTRGFFSLLKSNMAKSGPLNAVLRTTMSYCPGYDVMRLGEIVVGVKSMIHINNPEIAEEIRHELELRTRTLREKRGPAG